MCPADLFLCVCVCVRVPEAGISHLSQPSLPLTSLASRSKAGERSQEVRRYQYNTFQCRRALVVMETTTPVRNLGNVSSQSAAESSQCAFHTSCDSCIVLPPDRCGASVQSRLDLSRVADEGALTLSKPSTCGCPGKNNRRRPTCCCQSCVYVG